MSAEVSSMEDEKKEIQGGSVSDYISLLKPRVMSLVVFSGFVGLFLAPNVNDLHPFLAVLAIVLIALAAGAAGAINMWYERDIDALMKRTSKRALPQGRMDPSDALAFGTILTVGSVCLMGLALNWIAAGLLALASFFYVFIYTVWLKRRTAQNIVIGGAAGAFPPMIGWAAVTGDVALESFLLFTLIFLWTPPHFWALALFSNEDYKKAKVPMMPVVVGARKTKIQMFLYCLVLYAVLAAFYFVGMVNIGLFAVLIALNSGFTFLSWTVLQTEDKNFKAERKMFKYSIFFLFAVLVTLMIGGI